MGVLETRKPKRRWFQYSLRSLLFFVLLCALACSWLAVRMERAKRQRAAVAALEKEAGAFVAFGFQVDQAGNHLPGAEPPGPAWLRKLLGDDFFTSVVTLHIAGVAADADLEHAKEFAQLHELEASSMCSLPYGRSPITDAGLEHLKALTRLRILHLTHTQITDAALRHLEAMRQLQDLSLDGNRRLTDAGLQHLKGLVQLRTLSLTGTQITDAGLGDLTRMKQLTELVLNYTQVTEQGVSKLRQALPQCKICAEPRPHKPSTGTSAPHEPRSFEEEDPFR